MRDYRAIRAKRDAANRSAAKRREKAERERVQQPWRDLASPVGFGPLWENLSPQRHITPDPWDPSKPPGMPGWKDKPE